MAGIPVDISERWFNPPDLKFNGTGTKQTSKEENQDTMKISVIYLNFTRFPVTTLVLLTSTHSKSKIVSLLNT